MISYKVKWSFHSFLWEFSCSQTCFLPWSPTVFTCSEIPEKCRHLLFPKKHLLFNRTWSLQKFSVKCGEPFRGSQLNLGLLQSNFSTYGHATPWKRGQGECKNQSSQESRVRLRLIAMYDRKALLVKSLQCGFLTWTIPRVDIPGEVEKISQDPTLKGRVAGNYKLMRDLELVLLEASFWLDIQYPVVSHVGNCEGTLVVTRLRMHTSFTLGYVHVTAMIKEEEPTAI